MSDDMAETTAPVLRREALLPNERSRGLGTVAVVCTMAGVASGLALATTLMAMQVADTMSARTYTYRGVEVMPAVQADHGFLGITYEPTPGPKKVISVIPGTPAAAIGLRRGDLVLSVNGERMDGPNELQEAIFTARPGTQPRLTIVRDGVQRELRPTLVSWPAISY
ncbi:MAG TPA: PDZ domain-containing protein [Kofleriaceae bacterium]|nr:PDZ domain-containing protein [Kofleriaceae bacterium]